MDEDMLIKIQNISDDRVLSFAEIKEDNIYNKIPRERLVDYIDIPIMIGIETADNVIETYKIRDVKEICKRRSVKIDIKESYNEYFNMIKIRAEYDHADRQINIYSNSIYEMFEELKNIQLNQMIDFEKVIDIHIAHELFHHLEFENLGVTNKKLPKVTTFKLGKFERKSTVIRTREVAAHMFCKQILELPIHPKLIDYLYLVASEKISFELLEKHIKNLNNILLGG